MAIKIDSSNFLESIKELENRVEKNEIKYVTVCAAEVERVAKTSMRDTLIDNGKTYGKRGHHPSFPYNAPAVDNGTMLRSITHDVIIQNGQPVGRVGSILNNPPYPRYLEYGTSKMKPRPWLNASLIKCQSFMAAKLKEIFGK